MLAFDEVLAVPAVMAKQTEMTSKSTASKSDGTPYGLNTSEELALKMHGRANIQILGSLMEEREKFDGEAS